MTFPPLPSDHSPTIVAKRIVQIVVLMFVLPIAQGCMTSAVTLRHPETKQTVRCGPYCCIYGARHTDAANRENRCLDDYQRQGFERVPE